MGKSEIEAAFLFYARNLHLPEPVREYKFHPKRKWRFDFAWPDRKVAVECEGGTWLTTSGGRSAGHAHPKRFEADCWKHDHAVALGWRVFKVTAGMLDRNPLSFFELLITTLEAK